MARDRGWARAGRGVTVPSVPDATSGAFRSTAESTFIDAVSMPMIVPSTQFATQAFAPVGVSATAVGSEPTPTLLPKTGVDCSPVISASF